MKKQKNTRSRLHMKLESNLNICSFKIKRSFLSFKMDLTDIDNGLVIFQCSSSHAAVLTRPFLIRLIPLCKLSLEGAHTDTQQRD